MTRVDGLYQIRPRCENIWGCMEGRVYIGSRLPNEVAPYPLEVGQLLITSDRPDVLPFRLIRRDHVIGVKKVVALKSDRSSHSGSGGESSHVRLASEPGADAHLKATYK